MGDLLEFRWSVAKGGHRWARAVPASQPEGAVDWYLTDDRKIFREIDFLRYLPIVERPALFRNFAALDPTDKDGMIRFANENGMLGIRVPILLTDPAEGMPLADHTGDTAGESLSLWCREILAFRRAIWIHERVSNPSEIHDRELREAIRYSPSKDGRGPGTWRYDSHPDSPPGARVPGRLVVPIEPEGDLFSPDDASIPAMILLLRWVNARLSGRSVFGLSEVPGSASAQVLFDPELSRPVFVVRPTSLLAAMWTAFADTVTGKRRQRLCDGCGQYFEVGTKDGRSARSVSCSDACKSALYRRRKADAHGKA